MRPPLYLVFCLVFVCVKAHGDVTGNSFSGRYNILDYGASKDGSSASTPAINAAIDACFTNGGGTVVVPPGKYISGTIFLKDNVELYLDSGAILYASSNREDFPELPLATNAMVKDPRGGALIYAQGAENISITGHGMIDGRGGWSKQNQRDKEGKLKPRVKNILFVSCRNVNVSGIDLKNSQFWNQHYLDCEDVMVRNIRVFNHCAGNNDGIDIDGCRQFVLSDSIIDSDDDGIVMKSTGAVPCEDIAINNCIVSSHANAIKCGTESVGGFRNIAIANCVIKPSRVKDMRFIKGVPDDGITGISLEVVDGGSMDGVTINNIVIQGTQCPLYVRLGNRARKYREDIPVPPIGTMSNIQINDVLAYDTGNYCASITGIPGGKIENIYLNNIHFSNKGGLETSNAYDPSALPESGARHDMGGGPPADRYIASYTQVKEDEHGYPQPTVWKNLPSYGLFVRHVKNIFINNLTLSSAGNEPRVPVIAVDVDDLHLKELKAKVHDGNVDVLLHDVGKYDVDKGVSLKNEK
jgi:hypothetical protein